MRRIKLFKSVVNELENLESDINDWLASSGCELVSITGNIAPQTPSSSNSLEHFATSDVLIIVTYESTHG